MNDDRLVLLVVGISVGYALALAYVAIESSRPGVVMCTCPRSPTPAPAAPAAPAAVP